MDSFSSLPSVYAEKEYKLCYGQICQFVWKEARRSFSGFSSESFFIFFVLKKEHFNG